MEIHAFTCEIGGARWGRVSDGKTGVYGYADVLWGRKYREVQATHGVAYENQTAQLCRSWAWLLCLASITLPKIAQQNLLLPQCVW